MEKGRETALDTNEKVFNYSMKSGRCCLESHNYNNAIEFYRQALEIRPKHRIARYLLATCYSDSGLYWDSIRELNILLRFPKPNPLWVVAKSKILAKLGLDKDSLDVLMKMSAKDRANSLIQHEISSANARLGKTVSAHAAMMRGRIYEMAERLRRH